MELTDLMPLERSSNAYMINWRWRWWTKQRKKADKYNLSSVKLRESITHKVRLFVQIDLPNEGKGYNGGTANAFSALLTCAWSVWLLYPLPISAIYVNDCEWGTVLLQCLVKENSWNKVQMVVLVIEDVVPTKLRIRGFKWIKKS